MRKSNVMWWAMGLAMTIVACAGGDADRAPARTASAAEAASGSCAPEECGGQAADGCWCDELCDGYGDCCADKTAACDGGGCPAVLCEIYCPFGFAVDDAGCEVCACRPSWDCAGFAPTPCPDDFVCIDVAGDDCDPTAGGADCSGECVPAPDCPTPEAYCEAVCGGGDIPAVPLGCPTPDCGCPEPSVGSCEGLCGGSNTDAGCWCDDQCAGLGDCCPDKPAVCDGASCADRCGTYDAGASCQCDAECATWGDCCADLGDVCAGCHYDGADYAVGEAFPDTDGCNTCSCTAGGKVYCTKMPCYE